MNNYEKYLPLGTVVLLKGGQHRLMIIGYTVKLAGDENSPFYDYMGALYPEGIITTDKSLVFNHSDIDRIYAIGYKDQETDKFLVDLKNIMKNNFNL